MAEKARMWAVVSDNRGTLNDRKKRKRKIELNNRGKEGYNLMWESKFT